MNQSQQPERTEPDLTGPLVHGQDLRGLRIVACDLTDASIRGSLAGGMEVDSHWLQPGETTLVVNGVDVLGYVDDELNRRFPGRELRTATDPEGLRRAWDAVGNAWRDTTARAFAAPVGTLAASVDGEWSFLQTLRHLVMATDLWFGRAVLGREQPFHPAGLPHDGGGSEGYDASVFANPDPTPDEVLAARADRQAQVRDFLAEATPEQLGEERENPHGFPIPETVLRCLHTVLEEEWEHHRYAVRDLDALDAAGG